MINLIFFLYLLFIIYITVGFFRLPKENSIIPVKDKVTVVMAVKNESKTIKNCLDEFLKQTYKNVEFIIVDDNSTDETANFVRSSELYSTGTLKLLSATGSGKKMAIKQAIAEAKTEIILTADADVSYPNTWVEAMVSAYTQHNANLVIGPVKMSRKYPFQCMEYLSIMGITAGSAGNKNPLMCNACSMAFSKEWYNKCDVQLNIPSGDDMFLLESTKKLDGIVHFCNSGEAEVTIKGSDSIKEFFSQRARWTSKAPHYTDYSIIISGILVFVTQCVMLGIYVMSFWNPILLVWVLTKYIIDMIILLPTAVKFKKTSVLVYSPIVALYYPVYVGLTAILSLLPVKWKN
jgi:glycosyltransferase involved in cell wall biosynthesis